MKLSDNLLAFALHWLSRPITGKAGFALIVGGIWTINPPLFIDLVNLLLTERTNRQLPQFEPQPILGGTLTFLGSLLVVLSHVWVKKTKAGEVIGIRHQSLGSFPEAAIRSDLPLLLRLRHYHEIDVNHRDAYDDGRLSDHQSLIRRLNKVPVELDGRIGDDTDTPVMYYGLVHIPMAFYLGYLLADSKYNIQLYELNNDSERWDQLTGAANTLDVINTKNQLARNTCAGDIIVSIGISFPVHPCEIDELNIDQVLGHIEINATTPKRALITSPEQIALVCQEFKSTLEHIKNCCPNRRRIHLFYSGPVSLCFALGRCVSERIDAEIIIYNYSVKESPRYNWSLTINSPTADTAIFNQSSNHGAPHAPVQCAQ